MLEEIFDRWPDIPKSILIKIEINRLGVRFTDAAFKASEAAVTRARDEYDVASGVFTYEFTPGSFEKRRERPRITPALVDGTAISNQENEDSPYSIDYIDDNFFICDQGKPIAECVHCEELEFSRMHLEDGTPVRDILAAPRMTVSSGRRHPFGGGQLHAYMSKICEIWALDPCKFCDINPTAARKKKMLGERFKVRSDPEQVAEAIEMGFRETGERFWFLGGGTTLKPYKGKPEVEIVCDYIEAIMARNPWRFPGTVQSIAHEIDVVEKWHDAGLAMWQPNIEVWDPTLWKIICPGKDKVVGRDEWIRRTVQAVDVFGEGYVNPSHVIGVEMSKPYGFTDADAAVKSTLGGLEYLMTKGVVPRVAMWCIEPNSPLCNLAKQVPPPTEYYVEVQRGHHELLQRYGLHEAPWYMGWGRSVCDGDWEHQHYRQHHL